MLSQQPQCTAIQRVQVEGLADLHRLALRLLPVDGADLLCLIRTAYRGANSFHNSNRITFHRIARWRRFVTAPQLRNFTRPACKGATDDTRQTDARISAVLSGRSRPLAW